MDSNLNFIFGHLPYWLFIILMLSGLFIVVSRGNLIKKIVGLNIFQTSVFMFYISIGKMKGGTAPILLDKSLNNSESSFILLTIPFVSNLGVFSVKEPFCISITNKAFLFFINYFS